MKRTRRQKLLLSRLAELGEHLQQRTLPVNVVEVIGFGSFFRGKSSPKDVDLLFRCNREASPRFATFLRLLGQIRATPSYRKENREPLGALLSAYEEAEAGLPSDGVDHRALFAEWLHGYSWNMLCPTTFIGQLGCTDPTTFTKRLLRRCLPNLNVFGYLGPTPEPEDATLRAGFLESIWTPARPDLIANVEEALAPERVRSNTVKEWRNFEKQRFRLRSNLDLLTQLIAKLRTAPRAEAKSENSDGWYKTWCRKCAGDEPSARVLEQFATGGWLMTEEQLQAGLGIVLDPLSEPADLAQHVEQLRGEVKELQLFVEAVRDVLCTLIRCKANCEAVEQDEAIFVPARVLSRETAKRQALLRSALLHLNYQTD